jgi:putative sporulation protein YyaC
MVLSSVTPVPPVIKRQTPFVLHRIWANEFLAAEKVCVALLQAKSSLPFEPEECFVICIGSDRSTGDALGPLVGTSLSKLGHPGFRVFGTLDEPVHAGNLHALAEVLPGSTGSLPLATEIACERMAFEASDSEKDPLIIAVDASLGNSNHVGTIAIGQGPLRPGAGVQKVLPEIGHLFLTGTVNVGGFMEYMVLQNTRLSLVMKMAELIARGLSLAIPRLYRTPKGQGSRK